MVSGLVAREPIAEVRGPYFSGKYPVVTLQPMFSAVGIRREAKSHEFGGGKVPVMTSVLPPSSAPARLTGFNAVSPFASYAS